MDPIPVTVNLAQRSGHGPYIYAEIYADPSYKNTIPPAVLKKIGFQICRFSLTLHKHYLYHFLHAIEASGCFIIATFNDGEMMASFPLPTEGPGPIGLTLGIKRPSAAHPYFYMTTEFASGSPACRRAYLAPGGFTLPLTHLPLAIHMFEISRAFTVESVTGADDLFPSKEPLSANPA